VFGHGGFDAAITLQHVHAFFGEVEACLDTLSQAVKEFGRRAIVRSVCHVIHASLSEPISMCWLLPLCVSCVLFPVASMALRVGMMRLCGL
jgi:hypothetical protein